MKDTQKKIEKLEEDLKKYEEIAKREPAANATFRDAYENSEFPPYILSALIYDQFANEPGFDEPVADKTQDGRIRSNAEKAFLNGLGKVGKASGILLGGFSAAGVAVLTTPISLPHLGIIAGQSAVNANYNRRIEKAKVKVAMFNTETEVEADYVQLKKIN